MTKPLFIFEMANNHQGSVEHGKSIIRSLDKVCQKFRNDFDFGIKFQYRNLDTFIHPDYKEREDVKNVKRFKDTRLSQDEFKILLQEIRNCNFKAICTPFDEESVTNIAGQGYDYIKIASCSFTDWPLLEEIASVRMPVIASGAGSSIEDVKKVVSFFEHRGIYLALMHCVAEYPTQDENLQLNQIDYYKHEFPGHDIGFSTHENPNNMEPIKIAIAKGASIFEKHVGIQTEIFPLNSYSANMEQVEKWLLSAQRTYSICGISGQRYIPQEKELQDLQALQRGVFARRNLLPGESLLKDNIFFAFPSQQGQLLAKDISKYNFISLKNKSIDKNSSIMLTDIHIENDSDKIGEIVKEIIRLLKKSNIVIPGGSKCEISHHFGIDKFNETGVAMIDCVNREYCKKILVVLPGQSHPFHYHKRKEETFIVIYGEIEVTVNEKSQLYHRGDTVVVEREVNHSFTSKTGCVFEEISTTHYVDDSFYEQNVEFVKPRKTVVYITDSMIREMID
ncbi:N-acetylneuraminate synthase family protein [Eisenbergiella tayi]|uniref:N-acetylneuraminate synthase family protein n=1 Tax=Eisenbergiella tayi TaxID=1432052 RepID=UPI000848E228|nr:N-acetylneuraminate synthase family protein [Eisenbergiella tayi]ODR36037.1 hypothetical protein BEI60_15525 [Eisenbergiella tayi]